MRQIALPLTADSEKGGARIVTGAANAHVIDAFANTAAWPFRTAILFGPPRSGKSLLARWFAGSGLGEAVDDGEAMDETELFHRWNRAREAGRALLIVCNRDETGWPIALPDLASRIGAALHLSIAPPDDAMMAQLIELHAEKRGLVLDSFATSYLVPRCERSHMAAERLVGAIDRLSLERKQPPTLGIWRDALREIADAAGRTEQPRLL
ncbi:MAG: ATPase [Novosphingobium sp.]|nr:ATPase [Novosphingobium sp.]